MRISEQIQGLPEDFLVGCFISGLRDVMKYELISKKPMTLEEAMRLSRVEEKSMVLRRGQRVPYSRSTQQTTTSRRVNAGTGGSGTKNSTSTPTHSSPLVKKLTPQEIRDKREKGLCFYRNETYVAGHKYHHQNLYRLEVLPEADKESKEEWGFKKGTGEPQPPIELSASTMA